MTRHNQIKRRTSGKAITFLISLSLEETLPQFRSLFLLFSKLKTKMFSETNAIAKTTRGGKNASSCCKFVTIGFYVLCCSARLVVYAVQPLTNAVIRYCTWRRQQQQYTCTSPHDFLCLVTTQSLFQGPTTTRTSVQLDLPLWIRKLSTTMVLRMRKVQARDVSGCDSRQQR